MTSHFLPSESKTPYEGPQDHPWSGPLSDLTSSSLLFNSSTPAILGVLLFLGLSRHSLALGSLQALLASLSPISFWLNLFQTFTYSMGAFLVTLFKNHKPQLFPILFYFVFLHYSISCAHLNILSVFPHWNISLSWAGTYHLFTALFSASGTVAGRYSINIC